MKNQIDKIINALKEIREAEVVLAEEYGIRMVDNYNIHTEHHKGQIHVWCGIDELAENLKKTPKEEKRCFTGTPYKKFVYKGIEITQGAEEKGYYYRRAYE